MAPTQVLKKLIQERNSFLTAFKTKPCLWQGFVLKAVKVSGLRFRVFDAILYASECISPKH
jgi:hypothetical protein